MPTTVTIPIGGLNQIPGVSGLRDVSFDVPMLDEIIDAIERNTLDQTDIDDRLVEFVGESGQTVFEALAEGIDLSDDAIAEVVAAIEGATGVDVPGDGSVIDGVADVTLGREDVEDIIAEGVMDVFQDVTPNDVDVEIEGIFGPLSQDVAEALEDIIGFDPDEFVDDIVAALEEALGVDVPGDGPILDDLPTAGDIPDAVAEAVDGLSPAHGGAEWFTDPLGFLRGLWDDLKGDVLDPEVRRELIAAIDEATDGDGELI